MLSWLLALTWWHDKWRTCFTFGDIMNRVSIVATSEPIKTVQHIPKSWPMALVALVIGWLAADVGGCKCGMDLFDKSANTHTALIELAIWCLSHFTRPFGSVYLIYCTLHTGLFVTRFWWSIFSSLYFDIDVIAMEKTSSWDLSRFTQSFV